jgi:hypothetical protein
MIEANVTFCMRWIASLNMDGESGYLDFLFPFWVIWSAVDLISEFNPI